MVRFTPAARDTATPAYGDGIVSPDQRRLPWDVMGRGLSAQDYPDVSTALAAAGLDYQVEVMDLYAAPRTQASVSEPTGLIHAPSLRTIVRPMPDGTQKVLAASGVRYTPIQNRDAFAVADDLVRDHGSKIVGAADFRSGGSSILVVDVNAPVTLRKPGGDVDVTDLSVVIRNAHDGSSALTFAITGVRVQCTNMLRAAIKGAHATWKVSHTPNAQGRVDLAGQAIREVIAYRDEFTVAAQAMMDQEMTDREFQAIVERMWPVRDDKRETKAGQAALARHAEVVNLYQSSETLDGVRGTLWGGMNALTEWYDWARPVRQEDAAVARAEGALDGPYARRKAGVWDMFLAAV